MRPFFCWVVVVSALVLAACNPAGEATTPAPTATDPPAPAGEPATATTPAGTATPAAATPVVPTITPTPLGAESQANADVQFVRAVRTGENTWTFHVTVAHPDTGWEDYADGWDVVLPDGTVIKPDPGSPFTRLLLHPHENEQPFTRSQSGIRIPDGVTQVTVRAHDLVHGFGGQEVVVDLTVPAGEFFEVEN